MQNAPVGNITRIVPTVGPGDTIGRLAESLRVSGLSELPVVYGGRLVGMAAESAVLAALTSGDPLAAAEKPVSSIMSDRVVSINPYVTVGQAAEILDDHKAQVLPVINEFGGYLGVVTRPDISSALCLTIRPPSVGGMATPLGVYLSTGHIRAGASDLGLVLTGVVMMLMMLAATWFIFGLAWVLQQWTPLHLWAILHSPAVGVPNWMDTVKFIMLGMSMPLWMLLIRLMPLSGYHAAEHQVVHAIEQGEPLKPENVMLMPRVHPRCGTNIFGGAILFLMMTQVLPYETAVLIAVFVLIFTWKTIGGFFQYYVTTKPPNQKQVESGIKAGEGLLELYRKNPSYQVFGWRRIWNTGMPQVMLGASLTMALGQIFQLLPGGSF